MPLTVNQIKTITSENVIVASSATQTKEPKKIVDHIDLEPRGGNGKDEDGAPEGQNVDARSHAWKVRR